MLNSISRSLKKAYEKKAITKKDYEKALEAMRKGMESSGRKKRRTQKTGEAKEIVLGEIKIIKDETGARIVFDSGKDQIPLGMDSRNVNIPAPFFYDLIRMGNYMPLFSGQPVQPVMMQGSLTSSPQSASYSDPGENSMRQKTGYNGPNNQTEELRALKERMMQNGRNDNPMAPGKETIEEDMTYEDDDSLNEDTEEKISDAGEKELSEEKRKESKLKMETPEEPGIELTATSGNGQVENKYEFGSDDSSNIDHKDDNSAGNNEMKPPPNPQRDNASPDNNIINKKEPQKVNADKPAPSFGQGIRYTIGDEQKNAGIKEPVPAEKDPDLIDMKKELPLKKKDAAKKKKKKKIKKQKDNKGLFSGVAKIFKGTKNETRDAKLERMAKENLEKVKSLTDSRRAIVKVAHVLKDFLEIKMEVTYSTTYSELIDIVKHKKNIHDDIKKEIIGFYRRIEECEYSRGFDGHDFTDYYKSALKIIEEMSD